MTYEAAVRVMRRCNGGGGGAGTAWSVWSRTRWREDGAAVGASDLPVCCVAEAAPTDSALLARWGLREIVGRARQSLPRGGRRFIVLFPGVCPRRFA